jgi:hypothetical protein
MHFGCSRNARKTLFRLNLRKNRLKNRLEISLPARTAAQANSPPEPQNP